MKNLTDPRWIKLKAALFFLLGLSSAALLLSQCFTIQTVLLLCFTVWSFCRLYYFAFYVIERYVDPSYRFSGLSSFLLYWFRK
jgi:hypothetical protein